MTLMTKIIVLALAILTAYAILIVSMAFHDRETRSALLHVVAQELPPHASNAQMLKFMQSHTTRYAVDEEFNHEYGGFIPQTTLDRDLFDRQVEIILKFDENHTLVTADVMIFYTFL